MIDTEFEVSFRSIRIGSLKTLPLHKKKGNNVTFTTGGFEFKVRLHSQDPDDQAVNIVIPSKNITQIDAYLLRNCPVIWVKTDPGFAKKIQMITGMKLTEHPSPYYDPKAKEPAEQKISIIPAEDPLPCILESKFCSICRDIAASKNLEYKDFFQELSRYECNVRLVQCTKYITHLIKFQSTFREKSQVKTETRSAILGSETEINSPIFDPSSAPIVISSDSDEEEETEEKRAASPDLFDFGEEEIPEEEKKEKIDRWIAGEDDSSSDEETGIKSKRLEGKRKVVESSSQGIERKKKKDKGKKQLGSREIHKEILLSDLDMESTESDCNSTRGGTLSTDIENPNSDKETPGSNTAHGHEMSYSKKLTNFAQKVGEVPMNEKGAGAGEAVQEQELQEVVLESNQIPLGSIRGTAALSNDMQTLHQDVESMLSATPLCICVVKSPYVINLSTVEAPICMGIDNVDGRLTGCINPIGDPVMIRPSKNVPVHGLCDDHRTRMIQHECCPGCGTFCSGGTFLVCECAKKSQHRFHRNCLILTRHSMDCPHCGSPMSKVHEVTIDPSHDLKLRWKPKKKQIEKKNKLKEPTYPDIVSRIPGITIPLPDSFTPDDTVNLVPDRESLENLLLHLELEMPKKRFQPKIFFQHIKQNEIVKVLQLLCGAGADPNCRLPNSMKVPLHEAVATNNLAMVHLLVMAGADVNAEDDEGKTPLFVAEESGRYDIVRYLLMCKANPTHKDCEGMTPLHHAAKQGRAESCQVLLRQFKDGLNCEDDGGWIPLVWAAEHRQTTAAECLMYYGADTNKIDKEGNVCLQWAALAGNTEILEMCLKKHCSIDHQNMHGDTALHIAARENNYGCVALLLGWGADPEIKNKEGQRPADCAPEDSMCWMSLKINSLIRNSISDYKGFVPFDRERVLNKDVSRGIEKLAISCVNAVDEFQCPAAKHEFLYINENLHLSKRVVVNEILSIIKSCTCTHDCTSKSCECNKRNGSCLYDADGRLMPGFNFQDPPRIFECNKLCKCMRTCRNRVIQGGGVRFRLQVYRTPGIGWGVRALEMIPRGAFVCEFVGEVIADGDSQQDDTYLFDLENKVGGAFCINARNYGNVSRFINHLCEPNLAPVRFFVDHQDLNFPRVALFACKVINVGEQLGFDYGDGFWNEKSHLFNCDCGSKICRYSAQMYQEKNLREEEEKLKSQTMDEE